MTVPSGRTQLSDNIPRSDDDPREWAPRREDQGWDVLAVTDHLVTDYRLYRPARPRTVALTPDAVSPTIVSVE